MRIFWPVLKFVWALAVTFFVLVTASHSGNQANLIQMVHQGIMKLHDDQNAINGRLAIVESKTLEVYEGHSEVLDMLRAQYQDNTDRIDKSLRRINDMSFRLKKLEAVLNPIGVDNAQ